MAGIEQAKTKLLGLLAAQTGWRAIHLAGFAADWKLSFEDLKDAAILLHEEGCIALRKWENRWVDYHSKIETWFFYHSNFEARLLARGRARHQSQVIKPSASNLPTSTVKRVHFDDFDGHEFERLVLAYLYRTERWLSLEWYGQSGSDLGRDIWGLIDDSRGGVSVCVQCSNRKDLAFEKIASDIEKLLRAPHGKPARFILVTAAAPSAPFRDKFKALLNQAGIQRHEIWGPVEFEERLRAECPALLERFVRGETFPDEPTAIARSLASLEQPSDDEVIAQMARLFDRPAFYTPFMGESSIPAFEQAITDTIEALGTGVYRLRDGTSIKRMPSRHDIRDAAKRDSLAEVERLLCGLRRVFQDLSRSGDIRACDCKQPGCWIYFISSRAAREMDEARSRVLLSFRGLCPSFRVKIEQ